MKQIAIAIIFEHEKIRKGLWELIPKKYIIGEVFEVDILGVSVHYFINDDSSYEFVNRADFFYESVGYPMTLTISKDDDDKIETIAKAYFEQVVKNRHFERVNQNGQKYFYKVIENNYLSNVDITNYYSEFNNEFICNVLYNEADRLDFKYLFNILKTNEYAYKHTANESKDENKKNNLNIKEKYDSILNIKDAYEKLSKIIISQDKALKDVLVTIRTNIEKADKNYPISNILLIGPTGVGKTLIANQIANILKVPFVSISSPNYSPIGYKGSSITECLESLYMKSNKNLELAQHGIVFIDEIDKLAIGNSQDYIKTAAIQEALLTMVEGGEYNLIVGKENEFITFNTAKVTFIAAGAFEDITSLEVEKSIGFESQNVKWPNYKNNIDTKLIKYGMKSELMGRFNKILLNPLEVEDVIKIIVSEGSIFNYYLEVFKDYGIKFEYNDKFMEALARYSMEKNGGARGINQVLDAVFSECLCQIYDPEKIFSKLTVSEETVMNPKKYILK